MSDELARWLRAQLDEDERIARATHPVFLSWDYDECVMQIRDLGNGNELANVLPRHEYGIHVAEHDPARVLREVDSKRQLLAASNVSCPAACTREHTFSGSCSLRSMGPAWEEDGQPWVRGEDGNRVPAPPVVSARVLRLLAAPYADRPGYRQEWAAS